MLATAAKLSRALAATLDVVLSELALEVQFRSFASDYSVPSSGFGWNLGGRILADRIESKEKSILNRKGPLRNQRPFLFFALFRCLSTIVSRTKTALC